MVNICKSVAKARLRVGQELPDGVRLSVLHLFFLYINRLVLYTFFKCWCHLGRERDNVNFPVKQSLKFILYSSSSHVAWCFQEYANIHITIYGLLISCIATKKADLLNSILLRILFFEFFKNFDNRQRCQLCLHRFQLNDRSERQCL